MRYRSISLNSYNGKDSNYSLIKYEDKYKKYLNELKDLDSNLYNCVKECPSLYSEKSDHQAYMIFKGDKLCVGAIYIGTSTDEKDLEIEVEFNEKYFDNKQDVLGAFENLLDSLKLYFWDKENIEIYLHNNVNLAKVNRYQYDEKIYGEDYITYVCKNGKNKLITKLLTEIGYINLTSDTNGTRYSNAFVNKDVDGIIDRKILDEINDGSIPFDELFNKVTQVKYIDILPHLNFTKTRIAKIFRDGQINVEMQNNKLNMTEYTFDYNVLYNNFKFHRIFPKSSDDKRFTKGYFDVAIEDNSIYSNVRYGDLNIIDLKESGKKKITYTSPVIENSSIYIEAYGENEQIDNCYIDFRTHKKSTGKINSVYALRVKPKYDIIRFNKYSRQGLRSHDFSLLLAYTDKELYEDIMNGDLTQENINRLICVSIFVANQIADEFNSKGISKAYISRNLIYAVPNINEAYLDAVFALEQVKDEIASSHLRKNIEHFTNVLDQDKNNRFQKVKK